MTLTGANIILYSYNNDGCGMVGWLSYGHRLLKKHTRHTSISIEACYCYHSIYIIIPISCLCVPILNAFYSWGRGCVPQAITPCFVSMPRILSPTQKWNLATNLKYQISFLFLVTKSKYQISIVNQILVF